MSENSITSGKFSSRWRIRKHTSNFEVEMQRFITQMGCISAATLSPLIYMTPVELAQDSILNLWTSEQCVEES